MFFGPTPASIGDCNTSYKTFIKDLKNSTSWQKNENEYIKHHQHRYRRGKTKQGQPIPNSLLAQVSSVLFKSIFCLLAQVPLSHGLKRMLQSQEEISCMPPNLSHTLNSFFLIREQISTQPISALCPIRLSVHRRL